MTTVYTGLFGSYDIPLPQADQDVETQWIFFTDDENLKAPPPWETRCLGPDHPARSLHPRMMAVWFKTQPWLVAEGRSIWIDANMEVFSPKFVREILAQTGDAPIGAYRHNARDCVYDEAVASLELQPAKYHDQPLAEQVAHYRTEGHPEHSGLWSVGVLVMDTADQRVRRMGARWLAECLRWSYQTQLSFPVVLAEEGLVPAGFSNAIIPCEVCVPGAPGVNPWFHIGQHLRSD